mgnify:FL=1
MLFVSVRATTETTHQLFLNGSYKVSIDTIEEVPVSLTKKESYEIYLNDCNTIVKDTIRESGYINFDTIRVSSIPKDMMYFNKPVIKSVQISNGIANIIVTDTTWNVIEAPEYRSAWEYYVLAKNQMPKSNEINPDYSNKIMVFRMKVYTWKKRKPLTFEDWDANISTTSNYPETE